MLRSGLRSQRKSPPFRVRLPLFGPTSLDKLYRYRKVRSNDRAIAEDSVISESGIQRTPHQTIAALIASPYLFLPLQRFKPTACRFFFERLDAATSSRPIRSTQETRSGLFRSQGIAGWSICEEPRVGPGWHHAPSRRRGHASPLGALLSAPSPDFEHIIH